MAKPSDTLPSDFEHPAATPILHVDLDAFFASVEILDDPSLRGKPVAVGGAGERGVIASASYEARRYGVKSATPSVVALRLCPELIILPGRFDRYEDYSRRFHGIVEDITPVYEPLGLDECFLDVSSLARLETTPHDAARMLRTRIRDELLLDCGVGAGRSKLFAKLASKRSKARVVNGRIEDGPGIVVVDEATERRWLEELSVRALWGVGPATAARLERLGITMVRELVALDESTLRSHFGNAMGHALYEMARGRDDRPVVAHRAAKSIGHEETFATSLVTMEEIISNARRHARVVARALRASNQVARTISVGMKFDDLTSTGRSQSVPFGLDDEGAIGDLAEALATSIDRKGAVRLLGVSASSLADARDNEMQLAFSFDATDAVESSRARQASRAALNDAIDDLRRRFGHDAVARASELRGGEVQIERQRGDHAFGPSGGSSATHEP